MSNSGCTSLDFTPPAANVSISTTGTIYKLLVELDGAAATNQYSKDLPPTQPSIIPNATMEAPTSSLGRTVKLRTPNGCYFQMDKGANSTIEKFKDFSIHPNSLNIPYPGQCSLPYVWQNNGQVMTLKIICDGTDGGTNSGGNQTGGGNDSFGMVPGVQYSVREGIKITPGNFLHIMSRFKSTDCTGVMATNMIESGTYTLPTSDDTNSILLNGLQTKVMGGLLSDDSVAAANQSPATRGCGLSGWVKGTPRDLSTTICADMKPFFARMRVDGGKLILCGMSKETYAPASECAGSNTEMFQKMP
jgi:hypothetical protein